MAELIPRNGFAFDAFFALAVPLTDAVAAAHERGIVHRDLKTANVMVANDGRAKVLDFGLAKTAGTTAASRGGSELVTEAMTREGVIAGTPSYMSPEQARGERVDHRTDVFALGIISSQLVTGRKHSALRAGRLLRHHHHRDLFVMSFRRRLAPAAGERSGSRHRSGVVR